MREVRLVVAFVLALFLLFPTVYAASTSASGVQFPLLWSADLNGENFNVRAADLNGDGKGEIVVDSIYIALSVGKSGLLMAFQSNGSILWSYHAGLLEDSYTAPDGKTAVASFGQAIMLGTDGKPYLVRSMRTGPTTIMAQKVYAADLDGDGTEEPVSSINFGMKGSHLKAWNSKGDQLFDRSYKGLDFPNVIDAVDVDGDKHKELLVGVMRFAPNTMGQKYDISPEKAAYIELVNLAGAVRWSFPTEGGVTSIAADDVNGDGNPEIFVGTRGKLYALDGKGNKLWKLGIDGDVSSIQFGDVNRDGKDEIFVAAGKLYALDQKGGSVWTYASGTAYSLKVSDIDGDGQVEAVVGSNNVRYVESDGSLIWKSDSYSKVRSVDVFDLDGDGFPEIIAGCSDSNLRVFKTADYLMKKKAEVLYQRAIEFSSDKKYPACIEYASNSSELYNRSGDAAASLTSKNLKEKCVKYLDATNNANKSQQYFSQGDYGNATYYADKALDVYRQLGDTKGAGEVTSLKEKIRLTPLSGQYLNYSNYYFCVGEYDNASFYAIQAREAYTYSGNGEGIVGANLILDNISRMQAYGLIDLALNYSAQGLSNASTILQDANNTFIRLNDPVGIQAVQNASAIIYPRLKAAEAVNSANSAISGTIAKIQENMMVILAFIVVGVIILLVLVAVALSLYVGRGSESEGRKPTGSYLIKPTIKKSSSGLSGINGKIGKGGDGIPLF